MTIINGTLTELMPTNRQKSFYGKAVVCSYPDGSKTLYSYNTPILRINADNSLEKLWDGYSATTMKHINSFCDTYGINGGGKSGGIICKKHNADGGLWNFLQALKLLYHIQSR